jgi:predicted small integral membrane protein
MKRPKDLIKFLPLFSPFPTGWNIPDNVCDWVTRIFQLVITVGVIIAVILFLIGGIQYLTAAGNEEATGKAKRLILDAVIGLILVLAAWAFATFLVNYLGANYEEACRGSTVY